MTKLTRINFYKEYSKKLEEELDRARDLLNTSHSVIQSIDTDSARLFRLQLDIWLNNNGYSNESDKQRSK